jgi:acetyltransferase-like isoleucine patch superfamily enzyme
VKFGKHCFISIPGGQVTIGDQSWFSDRCVMLVSPKPRATLRIGSDCFFARDVHFSCYGEIKIGDNVRIAEFSSLHDSPHSFMNRQVSINQQGDIIGSIVIEDDVWIGQGAILLGSPAGLTIGKGAVIGAHSVVKESIPDFAVAVGSPAKVVKYRR